MGLIEMFEKFPIDHIVGSRVWRYFYLIALGINIGFIISYFDYSNNLWFMLFGVVSSLIALYWNYTITQRNKSNKVVEEITKIYSELNELIDSPDESEIIKINAGKWNLFWQKQLKEGKE